MQEFSRSLGDTVKTARKRLGLTQLQVANMIGIDQRTVLNIENYVANPKMNVLFPLIRILRIDAREIFNPEMQRDSPNIQQIRFLVEDCTEQEASAIIPIIESILATLRSGTVTNM